MEEQTSLKKEQFKQACISAKRIYFVPVDIICIYIENNPLKINVKY
jgi:hypothetical protein